MPKPPRLRQDIQRNIPIFSLINSLIIINTSAVEIEKRKTYCLSEKKTNLEYLEIYPIPIFLKPLINFSQNVECYQADC